MAASGEPAVLRPARPVVGAALVLGAASLWATFGIFAKRLYDAGFAPLELASVRAAAGFAAIAVLTLANAAVQRGRTRRHGGVEEQRDAFHVGWRALPFFAAYGVLGYALFTLAYFASLERSTVSIAVALLYTAPAFVLLMSALLWKERVSGTRIVALVLVLAGVTLVTGAAGALLRGTATLPGTALLVGLAAGATYAVYTVFSKIATERYGPAAALFWSFGFAAVAFAVLAPPHLPFIRAPQHTLLLLALGIVPTLIPYALYLAALRELRASTASMLAAVEPMIAAILAALLLGERLQASQTLGMALIVAAAVVLARRTAGQA
ncbi:EamA family transporter [soil metagenome]